MRTRIAAGAAVATLALLLAGCGGTSDSSAYQEDYGAVENVAPEAVGGAMEAPQDSAASRVGDTSVAVTTMDRQVVRTGSMGLRADDVAATVPRIRSLATAAGGFVTAENTSTQGEYAYSSITVQVPADKLDAFVDQVAKLGTVESVDLSAQDVTSQVVDLDARIKALQTSVDRMTDLMAQASRIDDLLVIETQLSQRQAELDALKAQRAWLGEQVAMSTLTVSVSAVQTVKPVDAPGFANGLEQGWAAFVSAVLVAVTAVGFFLPFLIALLVIGVPLVFLLVWLTRRHRQRTTERAAALRATGSLPAPQADPAPSPTTPTTPTATRPTATGPDGDQP